MLFEEKFKNIYQFNIIIIIFFKVIKIFVYCSIESTYNLDGHDWLYGSCNLQDNLKIMFII